MTAKFALLAVFLCLGTLIGSVRASPAVESALQKLEAQGKKVHLYRFRLWTTDERIGHFVWAIRSTGDILTERAHFELQQLGSSYDTLAFLMNSSKDVRKCMSDKLLEAQKKNEDFFANEFDFPIRDAHSAIENNELKIVLEFIHTKHNDYEQYKKLEKEAAEKLKQVNDPSEIPAILNTVIPKGEKFLKDAQEYYDEVYKHRREGAKSLQDRLTRLRNLIRTTVDETVENLQNCYFVKSPYYNLKIILNKLL